MTDESKLTIEILQHADHFVVEWDSGESGGSMPFQTKADAEAFAKQLEANSADERAVLEAVQAVMGAIDGIPPLTASGVAEVLYAIAFGFMQNHHEAISILADAIGDAALRERDSATEHWGETEGTMQ